LNLWHSPWSLILCYHSLTFYSHLYRWPCVSFLFAFPWSRT
jgi:hypothetical protein